VQYDNTGKGTEAMVCKINIMLIFVMGVTLSQDQGLFKISDPTDVDCQNFTYRFVTQLPKPASITNTSETMLLQPYEYQSIPEHKGHLVVLFSESDRKTNRQKYGLPPQKSSSEPKKQYAWYIEDPLRLEREDKYVNKDTAVYANSQFSHRPCTYAKSSYSLIQNLNSSIRRVGVHYWIVAGSV